MTRAGLLRSIYDESISIELERRIDELIASYRNQLELQDVRSLDQKDVFLISYGDSITSGEARPLNVLKAFLDVYGKVFSHVHILPFYPYSSDDGFSVIDYKEVNSSLGDWSDIKSLANSYSLMFDAVINHVSAKSNWFKEHLSGDREARNLIFADDPNKDWSLVVRPRTSPLFHRYIDKNGDGHFIWTTFSEDQVDLDYRDPDLLIAILDVLLFYILQGASMLRLDAIGFMWKEEGTSCIHLPQTHALIQLFRFVLTEIKPDVKLITETNVPHIENISYFGDGFNEAHLVYNFTLPPLLAYSLLSQSVRKFAHWAKSLAVPSNEVCFFNFLASHDGVGVRPVQGILSRHELQLLIDAADANGGRVNYKSNAEGGKDPYEINCNYFSLLKGSGCEHREGLKRMILAHAVLLAFPGVPAIYIHSLLGSENDLEGMKKAGYNRAINRAKIDLQSLASDLEDPFSNRKIIYSRIRDLIEVKQGIAAFDPYANFQIQLVNEQVLLLQRGNREVSCFFNFGVENQTLKLDRGGMDLISKFPYEKDDELEILGYDFLWLGHFS